MAIEHQEREFDEPEDGVQEAVVDGIQLIQMVIECQKYSFGCFWVCFQKHLELGFGIICDTIRSSMGNQNDEGKQVKDIVQKGPLGEGPTGDKTSNRISSNREHARNAGQSPVDWL